MFASRSHAPTLSGCHVTKISLTLARRLIRYRVPYYECYMYCVSRAEGSAEMETHRVDASDIDDSGNCDAKGQWQV